MLQLGDHTKTTPLVSVAVNNTTIPQVIYKGQPVLTMKAIAALHGVHRQVINEDFKHQRKRFREGVDYFVISPEESRSLGFVHAASKQTPENPLSLFSYTKDMYLFTKSGYLMLVKSLQDDKAWDVQRTLVDCYFQLEEIKTVLKETGGVYVSEEAMFDADNLLIAKALKAESILCWPRETLRSLRCSHHHPRLPRHGLPVPRGRLLQYHQGC